MACSLHRDLRIWTSCWVGPLPTTRALICLCSLPTQSSPESLPLGDFTFAQGEMTYSNFAKHPLIYSVSHFTLEGLELFLRSKAPCGDGIGYQQPSISKTVLPNHARWDIGLLDARQWLQSHLSTSFTVSRNLQNAKNDFIEAKIHKLTESVIPNSVSTSTWLCVAYHLTWKALHTKHDKQYLYFWTLSKYKT